MVTIEITKTDEVKCPQCGRPGIKRDIYSGMDYFKVPGYVCTCGNNDGCVAIFFEPIYCFCVQLKGEGIEHQLDQLIRRAGLICMDDGDVDWIFVGCYMDDENKKKIINETYSVLKQHGYGPPEIFTGKDQPLVISPTYDCVGTIHWPGREIPLADGEDGLLVDYTEGL